MTLKRSVALDRLRSLCSDFLGTELSVEEATKLMRGQGASNDPLLSNSQALMSNSDQSGHDYTDALRSLLKEANPLAFVDQNFGLTKDGYYFEGELFPYARNGSARIYMAAKALAACDLGDTCDQSDYRMLIPCIQQGICVDSRDDLVAAMVNRSSRDPSADLRRITELRSRMTSAVNELNVAAFQPPN